MEDDWTPRWNPAARLEALPLGPQEGFILSRLDGRTRVADLPALTGLSKDQIGAALKRLVELGALEAAAPAARPKAAPRAPAAPEIPSVPPAAAVEAGGDEAAEEDDAPEATEPSDAAGTHRALYEAELHPLPADERAARAAVASEPHLTAFCYDPLPAVVKALLGNPLAGPVHARLVAQQHRQPAGLDALASRGAFAQDAGVRRWLLRNPQLPAALFTRLFGGRPLRELYASASSREIPETTRRLARESLRRRFATAEAEERVALIFKTEGRVLPMLISIPVDGRTAAQLCGRTYSSTLLVQNLARWSAAPPPLIAHLLRQELVRRSPSLRAMLQRHPNAPRT